MSAAKQRADTRVGHTITLHIPSERGWERSAMDLAASVARLMGFPPGRIDDIKTAVVEATLNAIEHGNRLDASRTVVVLLVPEGETLEISVRDDSANPFVNVEQLGTLPSIEDKVAGRSPARGWGTFLIRALVDEVEFSSTGQGNVVRMVIRLEPEV
jgi:serine/threonine-protein kinase RsbW